jgi:hypothetical protein
MIADAFTNNDEIPETSAPVGMITSTTSGSHQQQKPPGTRPETMSSSQLQSPLISLGHIVENSSTFSIVAEDIPPVL